MKLTIVIAGQLLCNTYRGSLGRGEGGGRTNKGKGGKELHGVGMFSGNMVLQLRYSI